MYIILIILILYYIDIFILYLEHIHNVLTYKDFITFLRYSNIVCIFILKYILIIKTII